MILTKQFLNEQVLNEQVQLKRAIYDSYISDSRKKLDQYDVFISYSWNDKNFAYKVVQLLERCGYTVYIDFQDKQLHRENVTKKTARHLVEIMKKCKALLFLYSPSSSISKWCPWEVGVFSGIKNFRCANLPLVDNAGDDFKNQE